MAALVIFGSLILTLSLVISIYAIIRIEVHIRSVPEEVEVPQHQLYTGAKDIYKDPEEADERRRITPEDVFGGDLEFQEIP